VGKPKGKRPLAKPGLKQDYNIKMGGRKLGNGII
jgi:hypothetical protein